jgi:hypothetical protein
MAASERRPPSKAGGHCPGSDLPRKEAAKLLGTGLVTLGRRNIKTILMMKSPKNEYLNTAAVVPLKIPKPRIAAINERAMQTRKRYLITIYTGDRMKLK